MTPMVHGVNQEACQTRLNIGEMNEEEVEHIFKVWKRDGILQQALFETSESRRAHMESYVNRYFSDL